MSDTAYDRRIDVCICCGEYILRFECMYLGDEAICDKCYEEMEE